MKAIILILTLVFSTQNLLAQVNLEFETRKSAEGDLKIYGAPAPFIARFSFDKEPSPLDTVLVLYSLKIVEEFPMTETAWQLKIGHHSRAVQLIGDSIIVWDGPHRMGDTYEGTLKFVPLRSGFQAIYIYRQFAQRLADVILRANGVSFEWCLDQDGNALFVGSNEGRPVECNVMRVVYFDNDELVFRTSAQFEMFNYSGRMQSIPAIGDTATLHFQLTANRDFPAGFDLLLRGICNEITSGPHNTSEAVFKGETIEMAITFVPLPLRGPHEIILHFESITNPIRSMTIRIAFVFGEDGGMRYALDHHITVPLELLPKGYRQGIIGDNTELRIKAVPEE